jgi:hypothetical protein
MDPIILSEANSEKNGAGPHNFKNAGKCRRTWVEYVQKLGGKSPSPIAIVCIILGNEKNA